jgi:peptide/nickel transport system permease protein
MLQFIVRRLLSGIGMVVTIAILGYLLLFAGGGNIARNLLGSDATAATVAQKAHELGLDRPLFVQLGDWAAHAIRGDFGVSWFTGQAVTTGILTRLSVTLSLVLGATLVTAIVATLLGVLAATRRGWIDRVVQFLSVLGSAVPGFLMALGLVLAFAIGLQLFKPTGYTEFGDSPVGWLSSITLPVIALSLGGIAAVTQQIRGAVIDALRQDYVRTLRSRGLPARQVIFKHVLRNAAGPGLAVLAVHFAGLLGGAVVLEQVFGLPGVGQVAVTATQQGDIPLVMGLLLTTAILVIVLNLLVDLLQGWLNPKVRLS